MALECVAGRLRDAAADFRVALELIDTLRAATPDDGQLDNDAAWLRQRLPG